jgi:hypothetical protein
MEARDLIYTATFSPESLHVLFQAFDGAWTELAGDVGGNLESVEAARSELAEIVLDLAKGGPIEGDRLKADAVLSYRLMHN